MDKKQDDEFSLIYFLKLYLESGTILILNELSSIKYKILFIEFVNVKERGKKNPSTFFILFFYIFKWYVVDDIVILSF